MGIRQLIFRRQFLGLHNSFIVISWKLKLGSELHLVHVIASNEFSKEFPGIKFSITV